MRRKNDTDGVFTRKDRAGYWISWTDAQGRRRFRKTDARTLSENRTARGAELVRAEQAKTLGFAPSGEESFPDVALRFMSHQKARLTTRAYLREELIVKNHLQAFFPVPVASIR